MPQRKHWPTVQEVVERARRGIIDDSTAGLTPLDFSEEEWREVMADVYAELAKTPNHARILQVLGSPERAALVEQLITARDPHEVEAAERAAEAWLRGHPNDHAIQSAQQYLARAERATLAIQRSPPERD